MNKENEKVPDRELSLELLEPPIHPLLIHMIPPFVEENNAMFHLQLNGEVVWRWREVCAQPRTLFDLLQASILPLGYKLVESARERVGHAIAESVRRFRRKMDSITNGKKRKSVRADTWIKLSINPEKIDRSPSDVLAQLTEENRKLRRSVEERAAELYDEMRQTLAHSGKAFTDVGKKQQHRHLKQLQ